MTVVRKKRLKLKKKNFTIFIICLIIVITSIIQIVKLLTNALKKENINNEEPEIKETTTAFENADKLNYYIKENEQRYQNYRKLNKTLTTEQIVTEVNIGLDKDFYTDSTETINLNTP